MKAITIREETRKPRYTNIPGIIRHLGTVHTWINTVYKAETYYSDAPQQYLAVYS